MFRRVYKISLGAILIILGVAGIFLPLMPGVLLILIGYAVIIDKNPRLLIREVIQKIKERCQRK